MKTDHLLTPDTADEHAPPRKALDRGPATHTRTATDPVLSGSPASTCSEDASHLAGPFGELLDDLACIGTARISTRNAHAELEAEARYARPAVFRAAHAQTPEREIASQGVAVVSANTRHWVTTRVLRQSSLHATGRSLSMHDGERNEIHRTTLTGKTDRDAWQALVELYSLQAPGHGRHRDDENRARGVRAESARCSSVIRNTRMPPLQPFHGFRQFSMARELEPRAMRGLLKYLSENRLECSVSVGNRGIAQENRMLFERMEVRECHTVVQSAAGHLKLSTPEDASCWAVSGILNDELRHSIELHDRNGEVIVRISTRADIFYWNSLLYAAGKRRT